MTSAQHGWVLSPFDYLAHALRDSEERKALILETCCGEQLPESAGVDPVPRGRPCPACVTVIGPQLHDPGRFGENGGPDA